MGSGPEGPVSTTPETSRREAAAALRVAVASLAVGVVLAFFLGGFSSVGLRFLMVLVGGASVGRFSTSVSWFGVLLSGF